MRIDTYLVSSEGTVAFHSSRRVDDAQAPVLVRQCGSKLVTLTTARLTIEDLDHGGERPAGLQMQTPLQAQTQPQTAAAQAENGRAWTVVRSLLHVRLQAVESFAVDMDQDVLVLACRVEYGWPGAVGMPRLNGADVLILSLSRLEVVWSLMQGPFPLSQTKRDALGLGEVDVYTPPFAQYHEWFTLAFPAPAGASTGGMRQGQVRRQERQARRAESVRRSAHARQRKDADD